MIALTQDHPRLLQPQAQGVYAICFTRPEAAGRIRGPGLTDDVELGTCIESGVMAVTSPIFLPEWVGPAGDANLADLAWVGARACRHEAIVEMTMAQAPVFPLPFGAVWSSEDSLRTYLSRVHDRIEPFLKFIEDKEEWTIKGMMDAGRYDALLAGREAVPGTATREPAASGIDYLLGQKQRAQAGSRARDFLHRAESLVLENLRAQTLMRRRRRILPAHGDESTRLLFHWAILIERNSRDEVLETLRRGTEHWAAQGLKLLGQGPWPAYSFCPALDEPLG